MKHMGLKMLTQKEGINVKKKYKNLKILYLIFNGKKNLLI